MGGSGAAVEPGRSRRFCGFEHAQVLGDYVAIPNRRVTQLGADGARSGRPVHWLDCACAAVRWPRSCAVGTLGWAPGPMQASPDGLCLGCLCAQAGRTASVRARPTPRSDSKPLRRTTTNHPRAPTQVNGMPAFRHQLVPGTQLRFDGEWKVRHTHRQPPSLPLTALGLAYLHRPA